MESLDRASRVNPESSAVYYYRGSTYRLLGQHERAIEDLNRAVELNPKYGQAYSSRALALTQLGKDANASEDIERAVELGVDRNTLTAEIEELKKSR